MIFSGVEKCTYFYIKTAIFRGFARPFGFCSRIEDRIIAYIQGKEVILCVSLQMLFLCKFLST